eukprot:3439417-Amphidinium_carterae.1
MSFPAACLVGWRSFPAHESGGVRETCGSNDDASSCGSFATLMTMLCMRGCLIGSARMRLGLSSTRTAVLLGASVMRMTMTRLKTSASLDLAVSREEVLKPHYRAEDVQYHSLFLEDVQGCCVAWVRAAHYAKA